LRRGLTLSDGWEIHQKKAIEEFMENARQLLKNDF